MMTSDEHETSEGLWQRVMMDAQPITPSRRVVAEPSSVKQCRDRVRQGQMEAMPQHEPYQQGSGFPYDSRYNMQAESTFYGVGSYTFDARLKKRLRRGAERIDAMLDLHGLTLSQAHGQLHHFIALARHRGQRNLLVITGKGRDGEGILRRSVPIWLDAEATMGTVQGYDSAANQHGGSGAFYVRVRRSQPEGTHI
jgi:DNA-nicking Smr family endonuclease